MLKAGRAALEREVGQSFVVGGVRVTGILSDAPRVDPVHGVVRETVVSVSRRAFAVLPGMGNTVTDGVNFWRIAEIRPGANETLNLVCIGTV